MKGHLTWDSGNNLVPCSCRQNLPCGVTYDELGEQYICPNCDFSHDPALCCECGASVTGQGKYGHLCADHAYEAMCDEAADRRNSD